MRSVEPPSGPVTVEELEQIQAEMMRSDPEYRARLLQAEAAKRERVRLLREAEAPIVADLQRAGVEVGSVWDLVNTSEPYPAALPVLLRHLEQGRYPERVMESLGRALAVKPSVAWWDRLKALYLASPSSSGEEDGVAVALAACATRDQLDDMIAFLELEERGDSRIYFLRPIKRLGGVRGHAVLESLRSSPTFRREVAALLRGK